MSRFHVIIPARLASSRLPNKPLADIGGAPMVVRVAQQANKSQAASVVVACDDVLIQNACRAHGITALLTSTSHASGTDRLAQAVTLLGLAADDIVVNVQGDEPFIEPSVINNVAQALMASAAPMATVAHAISDAAELGNPNIVKVVIDKNGNALYFSRSTIPFQRDAHGAPLIPILRHVGIYAYRAGFLGEYSHLPTAPIESMEMLEQLRVLWHGFQIRVAIEQVHMAAGVDTSEDLEIARSMWHQRR